MQRSEIIFWGLEIFVLTIAMTIGWFFIGILQDRHAGESSSHHTHEEVDFDDHEIISQPYYESLTDAKEETLEADQFLQDLANGLLQTQGSKTHSAPSSISLDKLCAIYSKLCNKTQRGGTYTQQEKLYYQGLLIYMISSLDRLHSQDKKLADSITKITLSPDRPDRRGSAGHTHVTFNTSKIDSRNEFFQVAVHESGHLIDLGVITGRSVFRDKNFTEFGRVMRATNDPSLDFYKISWTDENTRIRTQGPEHFVSGYAMKNIYEDFGESMTKYLLYNDLFKEKAKSNSIIKKKYEYFDTLFGGKYFQNGRQYLKKYDTDIHYWDVTKLSEELR